VIKGFDLGQGSPEFSADRVTLEVPGNMLANISARSTLILKELD
jgi:hypothetical protein